MKTNTPLYDKIVRMTSATGPLSIAEYMHLCHADPEHGYYTSNDPLGAAGDFVTAPEISQMFGEIIGAWAINAWMAMGRPSSFALAELGPGRGTLMRDMLRVASSNKEFAAAATPVLVETSPALTDKQKRTLSAAEVANHMPCDWVSEIKELPDQPTIFIGNEFLDALPFRQFIKQEGKWRENCVMGDETGLSFTTTENSIDLSLLPPSHMNEPTGSVFEFSPAREAIAIEIADHLKRNKGCGLFIDYGQEESGFGDTFQAIRAHQTANVLEEPGKCDLTSHVDFQAIAKAMRANRICTADVMNQGQFLLQCGLLERAGALGSNASDALRQSISLDVERLAGPDTQNGQMGALFKVLCFAHTRMDLPPFKFSE